MAERKEKLSTILDDDFDPYDLGLDEEVDGKKPLVPFSATDTVKAYLKAIDTMDVPGRMAIAKSLGVHKPEDLTRAGPMNVDQLYPSGEEILKRAGKNTLPLSSLLPKGAVAKNDEEDTWYKLREGGPFDFSVGGMGIDMLAGIGPQVALAPIKAVGKRIAPLLAKNVQGGALKEGAKSVARGAGSLAMTTLEPSRIAGFLSDVAYQSPMANPIAKMRAAGWTKKEAIEFLRDRLKLSGSQESISDEVSRIYKLFSGKKSEILKKSEANKIDLTKEFSDWSKDLDQMVDMGEITESARRRIEGVVSKAIGKHDIVDPNTADNIIDSIELPKNVFNNLSKPSQAQNALKMMRGRIREKVGVSTKNLRPDFEDTQEVLHGINIAAPPIEAGVAGELRKAPTGRRDVFGVAMPALGATQITRSPEAGLIMGTVAKALDLAGGTRVGTNVGRGLKKASTTPGLKDLLDMSIRSRGKSIATQATGQKYKGMEEEEQDLMELLEGL